MICLCAVNLCVCAVSESRVRAQTRTAEREHWWRAYFLVWTDGNPAYWYIME